MRTLLALSLLLPTAARADIGTLWMEDHAYVYATPGLVALELTDANLEPAYQWGVGGGLFLPTANALGAALGLFFEHSIGDVDPIGSYQRFRLGPEVRIGVERGILFPYAALELAFEVHRMRAEIFNTTWHDTEAGIGAGAGTGVLVGAGQLMFGAEVGVDVEKAFFEDSDVLAALQFEVLLGYGF